MELFVSVSYVSFSSCMFSELQYDECVFFFILTRYSFLLRYHLSLSPPLESFPDIKTAVGNL